MLRRPVRSAVVVAGLGLSAALLWPGAARRDRPQPSVRVVTSGSAAAPLDSSAPPAELDKVVETEPAPAACPTERPLATPNGKPPRLHCDEARKILSEMRELFAGPMKSPRPADFSRLLVGWLDPHGLWSAAPDAPLGRELKERAGALLAELEADPRTDDRCETAEALGKTLERWTADLRHVYDRASLGAKIVAPRRAAAVGRESAFQDDPVTEPARQLARRLGERVSQFASAIAPVPASTRDAARTRYLPEFSAEQWSEVVLAAAVRAYVPLVDPHGDWAPLEEEWSLYAGDPGLDGAPRLWRDITRTAVGVRIVDGAAAPLRVGDLVLAIDGTLTAGMPLEQAEQLARLEPTQTGQRHVQVLHAGKSRVEDVLIDVAGPERDAEPSEAHSTLESELVRYGDSRVLVVRIPEVPDGLGEDLGRLLVEAHSSELAGVLLDLRGNGGGSTDAAAAVLGLFLPGAPLFPLAKRDQLSEVLRALEPRVEERHAGPVAALVDGYTASAAEMIAGALSAYRRGVVLGGRTFGKGCIQEYVDDHAARGVLRVTTLLYALPDGTPVQRTGLRPDILLPSPIVREHEADLVNALPTYRGPDVRAQASIAPHAWPSHRGHVGPCSDRGVCRALFRLGVPALAQRPLSRRPNARSLSAQR